MFVCDSVLKVALLDFCFYFSGEKLVPLNAHKLLLGCLFLTCLIFIIIVIFK